MNPEALVLLEGDDIAQRLVATWPRVLAPGEALDAESEALIFERWARMSGVPALLVADRAPILFGNEICMPDGTSDPMALGFISQRLLRHVPKAARVQPGPETRG